MMDARWTDIFTSCESAATHFRNALALYERGGFDAPDLAGYQASMAVMHAMHSAHTSAEVALKRILDVLGEERPDGEDWHEILIKRMAREMPGRKGRPPVISQTLASALQQTRRFRHVAAHGYDRFDTELAAPAMRAARIVSDSLEAEIERFRQIIDPDEAETDS